MIDVYRRHTTKQRYHDQWRFQIGLVENTDTRYVDGDGKRGKQRNSFYRTPETWNDLPWHVVEAKALKEGIYTHWKQDQNQFNFNTVPYENAEIIE